MLRRYFRLYDVKKSKNESGSFNRFKRVARGLFALKNLSGSIHFQLIKKL